MKLCLIRHAEAAPLGEQGVTDDAQRPLTDRGRQQCRALAEAFRRLGIPLGTVLTSPLLRARQTAEEVLKHGAWGSSDVHPCDALSPETRPKKVVRSLLGYQTDLLTVVGHMPGLATLAAWLIGSKKAKVNLAKAGAAMIECESGLAKGAGVLEWLVTPRWYELAPAEA